MTSTATRRSIFATESRSAIRTQPTIVEDEDIDQLVSAQRRQMERKMDEARESAKRSLQMLDNSLATGVDTMVELDRQGEQLRRASHRLDAMDGHMKESDRLLRGMGSWMGALYNKIVAPGPAYPTTTSSSSSSTTRQIEPREGASAATRPRPTSAPPMSTASVSSLLVDPEAKRFWEETDSHLDQMEERIERLRRLGLDMGGVLEKQTREIEELDTKVQQTTEGLMERTFKIFRLT